MALETIYRGYIAIASEFHRPMQIGTPTWRAHPECLERLGFRHANDCERVNLEAVIMLQELRREVKADDLVAIAGVIGPRHDGYDAHAAPNAEEAGRYHSRQARALASSGVDLLYAPTFASAEELRGVADAMAATGLPYALAPVIDADGLMLDGAVLADVIQQIDQTITPQPLHYLGGCVHPSRFRQGFQSVQKRQKAVPRLIGLKANASSLPPGELDKLDHLEEGTVRFRE